MPANEMPIPMVVREEAVVRFDFHQRIQHFLMMSTFIVLALTGMPLKFSEWGVSQWWIGLWGGIDNTRSLHHLAAWGMIFACLYHFLYIGFSTLILKKPFPVWMLPSLKDFLDFFQEVRYYLGLARERPRFDRFSWHEKFDYWAIFWGMPVMAGTGLILMYPVLVTKVLPGFLIPMALVAHSDEAVLAVLWILIVHLYFVHLAPRVFPFNPSIFTGKVTKERYAEEHPMEYERIFSSAEEAKE